MRSKKQNLGILIGMAGLGVAAVGCSSAQHGSWSASADATNNQTIAAGTRLNAGQSVYTMPALPATDTVGPYALTGEDQTAAPAATYGGWAQGIQGQVFVPMTH